MKTTISIPGSLLGQADRLAKQLGLSRSKLLALAVEAFFEDHRQEAITAALDRIYGTEPSRLEPELAQIQTTHLPDDEW